MSVRRAPPSGVPSHVAQLQKELADLKSTATAAPVNALQAPGAEGTVSFDSLTENEKSAASLGVHPESWRPIGFLNVSACRITFRVVHSFCSPACSLALAERALRDPNQEQRAGQRPRAPHRGTPGLPIDWLRHMVPFSSPLTASPVVSRTGLQGRRRGLPVGASRPGVEGRARARKRGSAGVSREPEFPGM